MATARFECRRGSLSTTPVWKQQVALPQSVGHEVLKRPPKFTQVSPPTLATDTGSIKPRKPLLHSIAQENAGSITTNTLCTHRAASSSQSVLLRSLLRRWPAEFVCRLTPTHDMTPRYAAVLRDMPDWAMACTAQQLAPALSDTCAMDTYLRAWRRAHMLHQIDSRSKRETGTGTDTGTDTYNADPAQYWVRHEVHTAVTIPSVRRLTITSHLLSAHCTLQAWWDGDKDPCPWIAIDTRRCRPEVLHFAPVLLRGSSDRPACTWSVLHAMYTAVQRFGKGVMGVGVPVRAHLLPTLLRLLHQVPKHKGTLFRRCSPHG